MTASIDKSAVEATDRSRVSMTSNGPFAHAQIHHIALRVANAKASKDWFLTKLDFRVDREFSFGGMDFVWLSPTEGNASVID